MPTYALLGATGSTGYAILRSLIAHPPAQLTLNIFVRSRSKLLTAFPALESSSTGFKVQIFEAQAGDPAATRACLADVDVVMACIGTNYSTAGMTISYDTAASIVDALKLHRKAKGAAHKAPTVLQLRTISLNPIFKAGVPWIGQKLVGFCLYYVYDDLDRACKLYASSAAETPGLLHYIYVDPPSIHDSEGTTPTGYKLLLDGKVDEALSYSDLGAAFCELAERRDEFAGKAVGVSPTGPVKQTMGKLVGYIASGAKGRILGRVMIHQTLSVAVLQREMNSPATCSALRDPAECLSPMNDAFLSTQII